MVCICQCTSLTLSLPYHRRNNRRDRGRLVPQLLGWGTNNVLVPQLFGRSFQKARNFTASNHQNAGFSIWVFKNFPGNIPPDPHNGRGRPRPPQLFSRGCAPAPYLSPYLSVCVCLIGECVQTCVFIGTFVYTYRSVSNTRKLRH